MQRARRPDEGQSTSSESSTTSSESSASSELGASSDAGSSIGALGAPALLTPNANRFSRLAGLGSSGSHYHRRSSSSSSDEESTRESDSAPQLSSRFDAALSARARYLYPLSERDVDQLSPRVRGIVEAPTISPRLITNAAYLPPTPRTLNERRMAAESERSVTTTERSMVATSERGLTQEGGRLESNSDFGAREDADAQRVRYDEMAVASPLREDLAGPAPLTVAPSPLAPRRSNGAHDRDALAPHYCPTCPPPTTAFPPTTSPLAALASVGAALDDGSSPAPPPRHDLTLTASLDPSVVLPAPASPGPASPGSFRGPAPSAGPGGTPLPEPTAESPSHRLSEPFAVVVAGTGEMGMAVAIDSVREETLSVVFFTPSSWEEWLETSSALETGSSLESFHDATESQNARLVRHVPAAALARVHPLEPHPQFRYASIEQLPPLAAARMQRYRNYLHRAYQRTDDASVSCLSATTWHDQTAAGRPAEQVEGRAGRDLAGLGRVVGAGENPTAPAAPPLLPRRVDYERAVIGPGQVRVQAFPDSIYPKRIVLTVRG